MKKNLKRVLSIFLSMLILFGNCVSAFAAETVSKKEEVIYIMTGADGSQTSVYAVNIFNGGDIVDYGEYTSVKVLNTTDNINISGDKITLSSSTDKVYMQGTMKNVQIPWNISIRYFIDNKELSASDVAGKSGKLEILFEITRNEKCNDDFYDNYAVQATFTLNTKLCENITADGATLANVGSNKQLVYTVLPGKGLKTSIFADVTDFEMDAVSINGMKLNLNIEVDDEKLVEEINELVNAIKLLNDGTRSLDNGVISLQNGIKSAKEGLDLLNSKSSNLVNGSKEVKSALIQIQSALSEVSLTADNITKLTEASSQIKTGIDNLYTGANTLKTNIGYSQYKAAMLQNGLDIEGLSAGNTQAITELSEQIGTLQTSLSTIKGVAGFETQAAQLQAQIDSLQKIVILLSGNNAAIGGTKTYLDTISNSMNTLVNGTKELKTNYLVFDTAINELASTLEGMLPKLLTLTTGIDTLVSQYTIMDQGIEEYTNGIAVLAAGYKDIIDGTTKLYDGTTQLAGGTSQLADETSNMDTLIEDKIDELISSVSGGDNKTVSFISEKNTDVSSVQFVIKTAAIEKQVVVEAVAEPEEHLNFWQKLLRLFGL